MDALITLGRAVLLVGTMVVIFSSEQSSAADVAGMWAGMVLMLAVFFGAPVRAWRAMAEATNGVNPLLAAVHAVRGWLIAIVAASALGLALTSEVGLAVVLVVIVLALWAAFYGGAALLVGGATAAVATAAAPAVKAGAGRAASALAQRRGPMTVNLWQFQGAMRWGPLTGREHLEVLSGAAAMDLADREVFTLYTCGPPSNPYDVHAYVLRSGDDLTDGFDGGCGPQWEPQRTTVTRHDCQIRRWHYLPGVKEPHQVPMHQGVELLHTEMKRGSGEILAVIGALTDGRNFFFLLPERLCPPGAMGTTIPAHEFNAHLEQLSRRR